MGWVREGATLLPISSPYGPRGDGFHPGCDYSGPGCAGTPIHAVDAGVVVYNAYEAGGAGNTVTVEHAPGLRSGYMHMVEPSPWAPGMHVAAGVVLGYIGTTGYSTGPHLHLWAGTGPNIPGAIDPEPLFGLSQEDADMTNEQIAELGVWMQQQTDVMLTTLIGPDWRTHANVLGAWHHDTRNVVNAHTTAVVNRDPDAVDNYAATLEAAEPTGRALHRTRHQGDQER